MLRLIFVLSISISLRANATATSWVPTNEELKKATPQQMQNYLKEVRAVVVDMEQKLKGDGFALQDIESKTWALHIGLSEASAADDVVVDEPGNVDDPGHLEAQDLGSSAPPTPSSTGAVPVYRRGIEVLVKGKKKSCAQPDCLFAGNPSCRIGGSCRIPVSASCTVKSNGKKGVICDSVFGLHDFTLNNVEGSNGGRCMTADKVHGFNNISYRCDSPRDEEIRSKNGKFAKVGGGASNLTPTTDAERQELADAVSGVESVYSKVCGGAKPTASQLDCRTWNRRIGAAQSTLAAYDRTKAAPEPPLIAPAPPVVVTPAPPVPSIDPCKTSDYVAVSNEKINASVKCVTSCDGQQYYWIKELGKSSDGKFNEASHLVKATEAPQFKSKKELAEFVKKNSVMDCKFRDGFKAQMQAVRIEQNMVDYLQCNNKGKIKFEGYEPAQEFTATDIDRIKGKEVTPHCDFITDKKEEIKTDYKLKFTHPYEGACRSHPDYESCKYYQLNLNPGFGSGDYIHADFSCSGSQREPLLSLANSLMGHMCERPKHHIWEGGIESQYQGALPTSERTNGQLPE